MKRSLQLNPDNRPATWDQIKHWRDTHETAPVTTSFGTFDCDERSDARLAGSIDLFDSLPTVHNGTLTWKRADNTFIDLAKAELQQVYMEVRANRGTRGALLHVKAEQFKQLDPAPTPAQLSDLSFWLN